MKMRAEKLCFFTSPPLPLSLLLFQLFSEKNVYSKLARFCSTNQTKKKSISLRFLINSFYFLILSHTEIEFELEKPFL